MAGRGKVEVLEGTSTPLGLLQKGIPFRMANLAHLSPILSHLIAFLHQSSCVNFI